MTPRFPWWPYLVVLALIFVGAMAPVAITVFAANVAQGHGCTVTNGVLDPCIVDGIDKAPELQAMAGSFLYALFTWPAGIAAACVWFLVLYWHRGALEAEAWARMSAKYKPILIRRVSLWWYPVLLLPILALGWFSITGLVPAFLAPLSLFALFFWIFSLAFAIAGKLRKPRDPTP